MNLSGMDGEELDSADNFGSSAALNSRRKAQDRRTAHQSHNPSFASHADTMTAKPLGQSALLADQMLLHPGSAAAKHKTDPARSKQPGYPSKLSGGIVDHYQ
jgi:hypothetical protein